MPAPSQRTERVNIRLSPEMLQMLEEEAERRGMPVASFATYALSTFVSESRERRQLNEKLQAESVKYSVHLMIKSMKDDPALAAQWFGAGADQVDIEELIKG